MKERRFYKMNDINLLRCHIKYSYFILILFFVLTPNDLFSENKVLNNGYPIRKGVNNLFKNFQNPPKGYGEVAFYWWQGDTLKKERLLDQLNLLQNSKITSLQINYAHDDYFDAQTGARPHYSTVPEVMSDEWWKLVKWFTDEAKKRGISVSLSDYCLGIGQKSYFDEALKKYPDVRGYMLEKQMQSFEGVVNWKLPDNVICLSAYKIDQKGKIIPDTGINLFDKICQGNIHYELPEGKWNVYAVTAEKKEWSYDPMNPNAGRGIIELFYDQFEKNIPNEMGKGLNYFFSDELNFKLIGKVWNNNFRTEFKKRKGYDICPELVALWENIGSRTAKIRMDYNDVYVSLSEENYFKPIYDYNQQRGMILGCDHGGRGYKLDEFGDYFRTQRWNQGPGADQPFLNKTIVKAKIAASISHMYERPRVWLEGFYGSGWSTNTSSLADALYANVALGFNLFTLHGLYYTTLGRWWEWAPPCNHFRMPYWTHLKSFLTLSERLCYLMSQGYHYSDVAILYPVEAVVANAEDGKKSVQKAFSSADYLYKNGIDFDFMDYQSLHRADIKNKKLYLSGEKYSVLIVPSMKAISHKSLMKIKEFIKKGGIVINIGDIPQATELYGESEKIKKISTELFNNNPLAYRIDDIKDLKPIIESNIGRDFKYYNDNKDNSFPYMHHRIIDNRDVYAVYNAHKGSKCFFKAKGNVELWDAQTGEAYLLTKKEETEEGTYLYMPLDKTQMQLIVFSPEKEKVARNSFLYDNDIEKRQIAMGKEWNFEIKPVLNNKWGDYYIPASDEMVGAWIEKIKYAESDTLPMSEKLWNDAILTYGPQFLKKGPLKKPLSLDELKTSLLNNKEWQEYRFSWRFGVEGDCGRQGYHGLKGKVHDEFIRLGSLKTLPYSGTMVRESEKDGNYYYLYTSVNTPYTGEYNIKVGEIKPTRIMIDDVDVEFATTITLSKGIHEIILEYDQSCYTYFLIESLNHKVNSINADLPLSMSWNGNHAILKFNTCPLRKNKHTWYKFRSAPGLESFSLNVWGDIEVLTGEEKCIVENQGMTWNGANKYNVTLPYSIRSSRDIFIKVKNKAGYWGGAAFQSPIKQNCGIGLISVGNWADVDGLSNYSGGAVYSKDFVLTNEDISKRICIDLKEVVSTAEVLINGKSVGVKYAAPWVFDISSYVVVGKNKIEIVVYNTLGNLYTTVPTVYRKNSTSGLIKEPYLLIYE